MSLRALRDFGALGPTSEVLGVGAGAEATLFWLTNHVRRVVATDLYDGEWGEQAPKEMLIDPGRFASCPWDPARLVVEQMDALDLRFADSSFDGVFSSSSIEHFGDHDDVRRALAEIRRVLKPGGIAALSTEYRIDGDLPELPGILLFDEFGMHSVLASGDWTLVEPLDLTISEATVEGTLDFDEVAADIVAGREWSYPHLVLRHDLGATWTSVHVVLRARRSPIERPFFALRWRAKRPRRRETSKT